MEKQDCLIALFSGLMSFNDIALYTCHFNLEGENFETKHKSIEKWLYHQTANMEIAEIDEWIKLITLDFYNPHIAIDYNSIHIAL